MPSARLAFVGPSREVSPWLLRSIARIGIFEAICEDHAEESAAQHHARWAFTDLASLLREAEPDGVILHQPLEDRTKMLKECLAAGAGVLVTGAPGTAATCKRLASFSKLSGRFILAAPPLRFAPAMMLAKRLVESGKFGVPLSMTLHSSRRGSPRLGTRDNAVVAHDQMFEAVDVVHQLIGPIHQVYAVAHADGALVASMMTTPGVPVSLVLHASGPPEAVGVEIVLRAADGTTLRIDRNLQLLSGNGSRVDAAHRVAMATVDPALELGYEGLIAEFGRHLLAGHRGAGLIGQVASVVAATEAVFASAARQRAVTPRGAGLGRGSRELADRSTQ